MEALAEAMSAGVSPEDEAVLDLAERHRLHIDRWYYPCARSMHAGLADLFTGDARFRAAFDKYGEGLADFFGAAIRANAARP